MHRTVNAAYVGELPTPGAINLRSLMLVRAILPDWAKEQYPDQRKIVEGDFSDDELLDLNAQFYNIHYLPNSPSRVPVGRPVDGSDIDTFEWVFVDFDLKSGTYPTKDAFLQTILKADPLPTRIIDSGNGIHAYWQVTDLDAMSFLRLQRRLMRLFNTDEAVAKIFQLMRPPGFVNTKHKDAFMPVEELFADGDVYTCEQLDAALPLLLKEDEDYCVRHFNTTYNVAQDALEVDEALPAKFTKLLRDNREVKDLFAGASTDRSKGDYRLAHLLLAEGFTKEEALSVLVNCPKALSRAPIHRYNYAMAIVDKVGSFVSAEDKVATPHLSNSVRDILRRGTAVDGTKLPCWEVYDGTDYGFRLGHVLGLVGGAGSGKTTLALNYFYWFTRNNPDYIHLFVSLEQPEEEIARRWARMVGPNDALHDRVHVLGNYNEDGTYRNLSLHEIEEYTVELQKRLGTKVGCVVVDHIGILKKKSKEGENQGLIDICHSMKAFAKRTNTFLVMQSQTSREKAGIGDLELDKDAAYGTSMFEWYCDFLVTTWQPLKRVYDQAPHVACSAFKYCKIRHKNVMKDHLREDVVYALMFDTNTELLSEMTQKQEADYETFNAIATRIRNKDRKREPTKITKIDWTESAKKEITSGNLKHNQNGRGRPQPH